MIEQQTERLELRVSKKLLRDLKKKADKIGVKQSEACRRALHAWVAQQEIGEAKP